MAKKIGFIGLGAMGQPMSKNLLKAGFDLTVWNRTESKMREIVELGQGGTLCQRSGGEERGNDHDAGRFL